MELDDGQGQGVLVGCTISNSTSPGCLHCGWTISSSEGVRQLKLLLGTLHLPFGICPLAARLGQPWAAPASFPMHPVPRSTRMNVSSVTTEVQGLGDRENHSPQQNHPEGVPTAPSFEQPLQLPHTPNCCIWRPCEKLGMVQTHPARGTAMQERLPIADARSELVALIRQHPTLVLVGETGSGKTTQLPQFVLQSGLAQARLACLPFSLHTAKHIPGHYVGGMPQAWG